MGKRGPEPKLICSKGHNLTLPGALQVIKRPSGYFERRCVECGRERSREWHRKHRGQGKTYTIRTGSSKLLTNLGLDSSNPNDNAHPRVYVEVVEKQTWMEEAACDGMDPRYWFPDKGSARDAAFGKQVCGTCTVRAECLFFALETGQRYGTWGGITEKQRRKLQAEVKATGRHTEGNSDDQLRHPADNGAPHHSGTAEEADLHL